MSLFLRAAVVALVTIGAGAALAESSPPRAAGESGSQVATPVPGANSFTEFQARSRIEAKGYAKVQDLRKDAQSVWHGRATKDGKTVTVALDYQGNVSAE